MRSQSWLAPRLVAVTLTAIIVSFLAERAGVSAALVLAINAIAYAAGGFYGARAAIESLLQGKIDIDMLMVLAALGAAAIGQWHEGAILLFLFSLSNVLQDYAIGRSRSAIRGLLALYPDIAKVRRGEQVLELEISEIEIGDTVLIEPAERIPVDGIVLAGQSAVDESPISGESMPADKSAGDLVFAGTLNGPGMLDVRAERAAEQTTLSRIIQLVEEAQDSKAPTERFLEAFEQRYAKLVLLAVALLILVPPALGLRVAAEEDAAGPGPQRLSKQFLPRHGTDDGGFALRPGDQRALRHHLGDCIRSPRRRLVQRRRQP